MNILNRLRSIFMARTNKVLNKMENPDEALNLSLLELKEKVREIKKALLEVTTIKKSLESEVLELKDKVKLSEEQAELSIKANREDLAEKALENKHVLNEKLENKSVEIENLKEKIIIIKENKEKIQQKINDLEYKKDELKAIDKAADAELMVKEALTGVFEDISDITDRIERAESKIKNKTNKIAAIDELEQSDSLDNIDENEKIQNELDKISKESRIKEELEAIKLKHK
ncbi:PspA/IM30 family protein [Senegalia massiliensis]|uniref:PspA/IM30 family protein n=1 Tax=Senegalia massiliensis TaxID=1720316 RepID=UPI001031A44F|nr:PspA/IM30 family protein [Senegalia massiliensis]